MKHIMKKTKILASAIFTPASLPAAYAQHSVRGADDAAASGDRTAEPRRRNHRVNATEPERSEPRRPARSALHALESAVHGELSRGERYRALAEGCRRLAEIGLSTETQDHFLWMADHYSSLAAAEERGQFGKHAASATLGLS